MEPVGGDERRKSGVGADRGGAAAAAASYSSVVELMRRWSTDACVAGCGGRGGRTDGVDECFMCVRRRPPSMDQLAVAFFILLHCELQL